MFSQHVPWEAAWRRLSDVACKAVGQLQRAGNWKGRDGGSASGSLRQLLFPLRTRRALAPIFYTENGGGDSVFSGVSLLRVSIVMSTGRSVKPGEQLPSLLRTVCSSHLSTSMLTYSAAAAAPAASSRGSTEHKQTPKRCGRVSSTVHRSAWSLIRASLGGSLISSCKIGHSKGERSSINTDRHTFHTTAQAVFGSSLQACMHVYIKWESRGKRQHQTCEGTKMWGHTRG